MQPKALEHQLQNEVIKRGIKNCTDIDELKKITFKLLEMCEAQKEIMLSWMYTH